MGTKKYTLIFSVVIFVFLVSASFIVDYLKSQGYSVYLPVSSAVSDENRIKLLFYIVLLSVGVALATKDFFKPRVGMNQEKRFLLGRRLSFPVLVFLLSSWLIVIFTIYFDQLILEVVNRREIGNHGVARLNQLITIIVLVYSYGRYKKKEFLVVMSLALVCNLIPSTLASSRGVALPFIVLGGLFLKDKKYVKSLIAFGLSLYALNVSFSARGEPSFVSWWSSFFGFDSIQSLNQVVMSIVFTSFPGLDTYSLVTGQEVENTFGRVLDFILYLSPIPSILLGDRFYEFQTLNFIANIPLSTVGLNSDLFSEPYIWFGGNFYYLAPILLTSFIYISACCVRKTFSGRYRYIGQTIFGVCLIYFLVGGMVFSLRAATRPFAFLVVFYFLYLLGRLLSKGLKKL